VREYVKLSQGFERVKHLEMHIDVKRYRAMKGKDIQDRATCAGEETASHESVEDRRHH
jgi:hypothetical protein